MLAAAKDSLVQRADIIAIYEESGSDQGAADKAINRWLKAGRLGKKGNGIYELPNKRTPHIFPQAPYCFCGK